MNTDINCILNTGNHDWILYIVGGLQYRVKNDNIKKYSFNVILMMLSLLDIFYSFITNYFSLSKLYCKEQKNS